MNNAMREALAVGALLAVLAALYQPVFANDFVYDDYQNIVLGEVIHDPSQIGAVFSRHGLYISGLEVRDQALLVDSYRPISVVSLMWDAALSGRQPWAYHLTNLVLHLLSVCLVYLLLRQLFGAAQWPLLLGVTAWFAITPHPATAHIWINGRSDVLITVFGLGALLSWRRALGLAAAGRRGPSLGHHGLAALLLLCGLLSKEIAITLLLPALIWPEATPVPVLTRLRRIGGLLAVALAYLGLRLAVLGGMRGSEGPEHMLRALAYLAPLQLQGLLGALTPQALHLRFLEHEFGQLSSTAIALHWVAALAALGALVWGFRRAPLLCWGLLWFGATLTPIAVVASIPWPGFGRFLYLPSVGLAVTLVAGGRWLLTRTERLRGLLFAMTAIYLGLLAVNLEMWIGDFRTPEGLYTAAVQGQPDNPHLVGMLGKHYVQEGQLERGVDLLARAHQLGPQHPRYLKSLMDGFVRMGRLDAAERAAREGAERYEQESEPFHMLLLQRTHDRDPAQACRSALECLRKEPGSRACGEAFTKLVTRHPRATEYRRLARAILAEPEMAAVRRQVRPLMQSLK